MFRTTLSFASVIVLGVAVGVTTAAAQEHAIDTARSGLKIRVFKSGIFSSFAHDKEIEALVAEGTVHFSADPRVALRLYARDLRVMDPKLSRDERGDVQRTKESSQVLDVGRFPEISFQSTAVQKKDEQHWIGRGNLTLHGQTFPRGG